jgi:hypothetical protein
MLSSHLRLGLPSGLLPSDLPTKMLYAPLTFPMRYIELLNVKAGGTYSTTEL